jgi:plastocyanin/methionine-rich copper-binding protein CopC
MKYLIILFTIGLFFGCISQPTADSNETMQPPKVPDKKMMDIPPPNDVVEIHIRDFRFEPNVARLPKGTRVRWINEDADPHTIYINPLKNESKVLNKGDSYEITLDQEIVYDYLCGIHPFMTAKIFSGNAVEENKTLAPTGPPPRVTGIEPSTVPADNETVIAVKGENFREGATAFFHHLFGNVTFVDSTMLHVITPKHYPLKTGLIITNPDGEVFIYEDFTFEGEEEPLPPSPAEFGEEKRTVHFVSSTPSHGVSLPSPPAVAVDFNFRVVQGSYIKVLKDDEILAEGAVSPSNNMRLEVSPPALKDGTYKVEYHAVWPGGSAHDGQFYFRVE